MQNTNEIKLDIYRAEDEEPMFNILQQPEYYQNLLHVPKVYTRQHAKDWIDARLSEHEQGDTITKKVIRFNEQFIGAIGHTGVNNNEMMKHRTEIGYYISKEYWNKGFATKALKMYSDLLFSELPIKKIIATVYTHNIASAKALQKAGFLHEATFKNHYFRDEQYIDCHVYSLLKPVNI